MEKAMIVLFSKEKLYTIYIYNNEETFKQGHNKNIYKFVAFQSN